MLETERLVLTPPSLGDLDFVRDEINTPGMMRFLGGAVRSAEEVATGLAADIDAFAAGAYFRFTVRLRNDHRPIARVGLFTVSTKSAPPQLRGQREIGWMLAEAFQGNGHASEAARAVIEYAFADPALQVLWSQTSDSNQPSTRMMARLGFRRRVELDYVDPDYPAADNPTTVYAFERAGMDGGSWPG